MKCSLAELLAICSFMCISATSFAGTIYQWTDVDGIVHFSDVQPAGTAQSGMREITFADDWNSDTSGEKYSIIDQAEMMAEWRRRTTEDRIAIRRMELEEQRAAQDMEQDRLEALREPSEEHQTQPFYYFFPRLYTNHRPGHGHDGIEAGIPVTPQPKMPVARHGYDQSTGTGWKARF